jgi:3-dehydroquinate synthase
LKKIHLSLEEQSYEIVIGHLILEKLGEALRELNLGLRQMIVTSRTVWALYGKMVRDSLATSGFKVSVTLVDDDEEAKSLKTLATIYDELLENEFERSSGIVALGGGVVGDVAGFAAATYMRGIRFVQVPTTLLAQVDSSIGGKTGINHPNAKNLIGAFHQPRLVWTDISTLSTLPDRELRSGLAEVIKYSIIADPDLIQLLPKDCNSFSNLSIDHLTEIISRCCSVKAKIVEQDEKEQGLRSILNYGHTVGHALESMTRYGYYTHGEAIAIGMTAAARISLAINATDHETTQSQETIIKNAGLPTTIDQPTPPADILYNLNKDKKRRNEKVNWVLPRRIGEVFMTEDVQSQVVLKVLHDMITPLEG